MARTGSGKTAAFLIPLMEKLVEHSSIVGIRGLIITPTRELAQQTFQFIKQLGRFTSLRSCLLVGGDSMQEQFEQLANNPDIIIATPGRLIHHITEVGNILKSLQMLIFDEADRLFEMGLGEQLKQILTYIPSNRQTLLFSATLPQNLVDFTHIGLNNPKLIRLDTDIKISETLKVNY